MTLDEMRFYGIEQEDTPCLEDPHLDLLRSESYVSAREKAYDRWVAKAERLAGFDLDGNEREDGYSLDGAYDAWEANLTPAEYVAEIMPGVRSRADG